MPPLPTLSGKEIVRAFETLGWRFARQHSSHIILKKTGHPATLSVPDHKMVATGTLRALIRNAGISVEQFVESLR
jgi:predicted RNA binding protein YcfA (HicA-like mRNA interferase family)